MINVTLEGHVRKLSEIRSYTKNKGGKYCCFYLYENDNSNTNIRLSAYNQCCEKLHPLLKNNETIRITKINVRKNEFNNVRELQGTMTSQSTITKIDGPVNYILTYTPFIALSKATGSVDVVGIIIDIQSNIEKVMKDGDIKYVTIVTLKDNTAQVSVTL